MKRKRRGGFTLVELIVAFTIMMTLTAMAVPLARYKVRRDKERELRLALHDLRTAIDKYKDDADQGKFQTKIGTENYPETLDVLVEGVKVTGPVDKKLRYLRRMPRDPFTGSNEWGMRSTTDDPQSTAWGGQNVFDVYTKTYEKAKDGKPYSEW